MLDIFDHRLVHTYCILNVIHSLYFNGLACFIYLGWELQAIRYFRAELKNFFLEAA